MMMSRENLFINKKDEYYNIEDFESGKNNILFITGFSGSGKTTLGKVLSIKYLCKIIELDDIMCPIEYSDFKIENDVILHDFFTNNQFAKIHRYEKKCYELAEEFINYIIDNPPKTKLIVEGVQLWLSINSKDNIIQYDKVIKFPIVLKGTAGLLSTYRALQRDKYKSTLYKIAHKYTYIFSDNICVEKLRNMVKKENQLNMNSVEGSVYSSSTGVFNENDESSTTIESVDFNDLLNETSMESKNKNDGDNVEYIFIRNIQGIYKNILNPTNLLDKGIKLIDQNAKDGISYNHSTISTNLKDGFVGLTLDSNKYQAKKEYILHTDRNRYTNGCDNTKSKYAIFAIPVTKEERQDIEDMIINSEHNENIRYSIFTNFLIGLNLFANLSNKNIYKSIESKQFNEVKLVCSTFIGYILSKCCPSIKKAFSENYLNFDRITPNRLVNEIPNCRKLFGGIWKDYNSDLLKYLNKHPEFKKYDKEMD